MNSKDRIKYSEKDLIDVLSRMFNIEELENAEIDFERLTKEATESIIEKLYNYESDPQRTGFLDFLLKRFFDDGKGRAIGDIARPIKDIFYRKEKPNKQAENDLQYHYIYHCYLTLCHIISEVSEHCTAYKDVDFPKLLENNFRALGEGFEPLSPYYIFVVYAKPKTTEKLNENSQSNGGRPKKEIDENMVLETILHVGMYNDAKKYYQTKIEKGKLKFGSQYGQLIREFDKKDWIKPEYKKLSPEQMRILIFNEFNVIVSPETARKDPKGNEFEDIQKRKILQLPM